ncbi:hypothetical protein LTR70_007091 [Exophiala xenobiotica]|nr:hypothetical protein LTR70_007091 [Exophiala xenobiotica]
MSYQRPQDTGFRAPLRDIVDSIGTGRHVEGIHLYDDDGVRSRRTVVQLPDGLRVEEEDTASEASSGKHTDSLLSERDADEDHDGDDDDGDDGEDGPSKSETGSEEQDDDGVRRCDVCGHRLDDEGRGINDDTDDDRGKTGGKRRRNSIPCPECERPKRRKTE